MHIVDAKNAVKIGDFKLRSDHANKIKLDYLSSVPNSMLIDNAPRVYLLVVDGEIAKIGGSASKGGIKSTMSFYVNAMQGSPGVPRFVIHLLIEQALLDKRSVQLWMIVSPSVKAQVNGLTKVEYLDVASFKEMEDLCKREYFSLEGRYPIWNFQENNEPYPQKLSEMHNAYQRNRLARN